MSGDRGWLVLVPIALLVTGALALAVTWVSVDHIESDLAGRSSAALRSAEVRGAEVTLDGRDATVREAPADQVATAYEVVAGVDGVRRVEVFAAQRDTRRDDARDRLQQRLDEVLARAPITFDPFSDALTPQAERSVAAAAAFIDAARGDLRIEVAGHTSKVPGVDPTAAKDLSDRRAQAVADRLVAAGVAEQRVWPIGYGDSRPAGGDPNLDRRVEITVR
ncbi:outer membrane protein/peptidoglycan-associated (lipo)protein [Saccharomonospora marina XMU15]|uniref:Outer membrane protein/peptidoglycan-associated (Lipo)protein n=1 Tax=Saccharomonospora marina XMU15 TaxID=882083 RepID=H5X007_9PSEU|nr:OmpA family protein [Saccharomonospora marina]EHR53003.1 outer membrane protein/peptidoglycan-associated (lipo)protein [Saccharomonospora marina XMU15]